MKRNEKDIDWPHHSKNTEQAIDYHPEEKKG